MVISGRPTTSKPSPWKRTPGSSSRSTNGCSRLNGRRRGGGGVVDDPLEVAVAADERRQQLPRAVDALDAHRVAAEHQHVGHLGVAQHRQQLRQAEHLGQHQLDQRRVLGLGQRRLACSQALRLELDEDAVLEHVAGDLFAQLAIGRCLVAARHRQAIAERRGGPRRPRPRARRPQSASRGRSSDGHAASLAASQWRSRTTRWSVAAAIG